MEEDHNIWDLPIIPYFVSLYLLSRTKCCNVECKHVHPCSCAQCKRLLFVWAYCSVTGLDSRWRQTPKDLLVVFCSFFKKHEFVCWRACAKCAHKGLTGVWALHGIDPILCCFNTLADRIAVSSSIIILHEPFFAEGLPY